MRKAVVETLRALADPTRLRMLQLVGEGETCACELPSRVRVSQPAVSQHLAVLRQAGLVDLRAEGRKRLYRLSALGRQRLKDIGRWK